VSPFDPVAARSLLVAAARDGARVVGAVAGSSLVGVAVADPNGTILALGVAPSFRRGGLATALLRTLVDGRPAGAGMTAEVGVAERDWVEPLDVEVRRDVARRLLTGAGFEFGRVSPDLARDDPWAIAARLAPR
jgi:ribosomal protein S18 acetylase RimI-like enzyme